MHPIVRQLLPSPEQQPAVATRNRDILVTAGAGTGKTRTLVARFLSLLAEGVPLRSIIAITFTRKAAREMRNRVRDAIRVYMEKPALSDHERAVWQEHYLELDAARIDTIHGLCAEILRKHPAEARVDPRFAVLEDAQAHLARVQAADEALAWAASDPEAARLFLLMKERPLQRTIHAMLRSRLEVHEALERLPTDVATHWRDELARHQQQALEQLEALPEWVDSVRVLEMYCGDDGDKCETQRREAVEAIRGAKGTVTARVESLTRLACINLRGGSGNAWAGGKEELSRVKGALKLLRGLWRESKLEEWTFGAWDKELAAAYPALRALFAVAAERYAALKEEQNALDFDDLEHGALQLLRERSDVRDYWQGQARAILVDEFQDTNARQRDLARLLNGDQGKLFMVGDGKQSIYRFRGADVSVFRAVRQGIQASGGAVFPLAVSYRAHRELIEGLNDLLRPVLGEQDDPARQWVEPFARLEHSRPERPAAFPAPHIELHLALGTKKDGALDVAARGLAARLEHLIGRGGHRIGGEGATRPLNYGDVAILCRASTSFPPYEDALEQAGIPFLTVAGRGFFERPEVRDLLNMLRALADPTDDLALVGLLRSPAFGVSDAELYRLCQHQQNSPGRTALWDLLRASGVDLGGEACQRAARIVGELHRLVGRATVADVLKQLLDATDYRAAWLQVGQKRAARNVAKLLADAHASNIVGVGEFLEYVQGLRDAAAREGEARSPAEGAVQVMSVHQAKGLEFPVVVIGDVTHQTRGGGRGLLVDAELGVLLPAKDDDDQYAAIYRLGQLHDRERDEAESDRLLYVAATRAQEKLILSGCVKYVVDPGTGGWLGRIATSHDLFVDPGVGYDPEGAEFVDLDLCIGETPVACTIYEPNWRGEGRDTSPEREAELEVERPPLLAPVPGQREPVDERTQAAERDPPQRVWRVVPLRKRERAPAWVVGKLVHEALAAWRFPDHAYELWAEARARTYGLTDRGRLDGAVKRSRELLEQFAGHDLRREMESAERRLHEVPYHIETGGTVQSGIVDALCVRNGRWTIIEFKTDEVKTERELGELLGGKDYRDQADSYIRAMERLIGQTPAFKWCMLDYGGHVRVVEYQAH